MRTKVLSAAALLTLFSTPALAQEPPPPPGGEMPPPTAPPPATAPQATGAFGSQGQIAVSADLPFRNGAPALFLFHESVSMGGTSQTNFGIAPAADYFIAPNISIGGIIGVSHGSVDLGGGYSASGTGFVIGPRVGYVVNLNDQVSLWPRLSIQYAYESVSSGGTDGSLSAVPLVVDVPILWHPASHFFLGAGFVLSTQLSNSASAGGVSVDQPKTTDIGIDAMIGGYWGP
jgi:hypothetical protein